MEIMPAPLTVKIAVNPHYVDGLGNTSAEPALFLMDYKDYICLKFICCELYGTLQVQVISLCVWGGGVGLCVFVWMHVYVYVIRKINFSKIVIRRVEFVSPDGGGDASTVVSVL